MVLYLNQRPEGIGHTVGMRVNRGAGQTTGTARMGAIWP
jgi:hypothetical protein